VGRIAHFFVCGRSFGKVPTPNSHLPSCPHCLAAEGCGTLTAVQSVKHGVSVAVLGGVKNLGERGQEWE